MIYKDFLLLPIRLLLLSGSGWFHESPNTNFLGEMATGAWPFTDTTKDQYVYNGPLSLHSYGRSSRDWNERDYRHVGIAKKKKKINNLT